jgi:hypothetical protein
MSFLFYRPYLYNPLALVLCSGRWEGYVRADAGFQD